MSGSDEHLHQNQASISRRGLLKAGAGAAVLGTVGVRSLLGAGTATAAVGTGAAAERGLASTVPATGGLLRVGMLAEPPSASIANPWQWNGVIGLARLGQFLNKLTEYGRTDGYAVPSLATSWEPMNGSARNWVVKLREGVTFHNGKPFTADDVVYSFNKILDPETAATPQSTLAAVLDPSGMTKVNDHEIEFALKVDYATFGNILSAQSFIIPDGWESTDAEPSAPGTGPFIVTNFEPGRVTEFARNPNFWDGPRPYVDEMQFISITEESARVGALLSGEVDIAHNLSAASIQTIEGRDDAVPFISNVAHSLKLVMASRRDPFTELKVRQAFRLIVDRQAMIDQAVAGYGVLGNDLMCPFDPMYASELPQREQDLDQARSLLEEAGMAGMEVTLDTAAITPGAVETAQLFAQHAQEAGVTVTINNTPADNYFSDTGPWMNTAFFSSEDGDFTIDQAYSLFYSSDGPYNETQSPAENMPYTEDWNDRIVAANGELDEAKRKELWLDIQTIEYENGGLILPVFNNPLDAISSKVSGLKPHWRRELGFFQFLDVSLES
jgi:peptide/nickel transport system substrate-binding protein